MERRDPRYQQADEVIRRAFLGLFEGKDIEGITVSEIIRAAGVNRSTFYAHYQDKYALLAAIEQDFLTQMEGIFEGSPTIGLFLGRESAATAWEAYFARLVGFLQENSHLFASLVSREGSAFMVQFSEAFADALRKSGAVSKFGIPTNYQSALLAWATAGLVEEWARAGFADSCEGIVDILVKVAMGIQGAVVGEADRQ